MSSAKISIHLDENLQIIRQDIDGVIDEEDAENISTMTKTLSAGLKDPQKIRIFSVSNGFGKATAKARKRLLKNLQQPDLYKIAVMGTNPYMKTVFAFILIATGTKKVKVFTIEHEALRWLNE
jgi:hypothetical protein